ncbi:putative phage P2 replication protein [Caminibacter mediatlanticus TB-2]|uniref:Phage P2 replication protein n=1 Tax=Caminibacter mediatlanticus TB-2 TaxID=391592 RepID=A0AAI9F0N3_9BACT|nr:putative phage P2 replication protein [Caminibacter mediatlanticus TB-2]
MDVIEILDKFGRYKYDYGLDKSDIQFAIEKVERMRFYLDNNFITLPDGNTDVLSNWVSNWYVNPHRYISEIKHRIYSIYNYSKDLDLVPVFITITLPSKFHRFKYLTKIVNGRKIEIKVKNNNFDEFYIDYTPRDLVKILSKYFDSVRHIRAFRNIPKNKRLYFKIIEPHKTGDPHLHCMFFIPKENVCKFWSSFIKLMKKNSIEQYDFQVNILNPVNYLIKYVLKTIDDYRLENTKLFKYSPLALWYIRWGIRRFSMSRHFVRIDLYRKLNGRYSLNELTLLYKLGKIDYYIEPVTRKITDIFYNDDIVGSIPIYSKDYVPPKINYSDDKPILKFAKKSKFKYINVYNEDGEVIGIVNSFNYIPIEKVKFFKPINKMTKLELFEYEQSIWEDFDNPFNDEEDLDILFDKLFILDKLYDENYEERFNTWLRGWDLNPRPPGYEPGELPGCSTPRQSGWAGRIRTSE